MSDDDHELFRRAMRNARPIEKEPRAADGRPRPKPGARFRRADEHALLRESLAFDDEARVANSSDAVRFQRPSVGTRTMRRLARGSIAVEAEIDLHGMTLAEARPRLEAFLDEAVRSGRRCVRVVHGKGLGSGGRGAVLKPNVDRWLRRWDAVLAFVSSRQADGGTGAVYVLLRSG